MNQNQKARHGLYEAINKLYSANYSCYRISKQDTPEISAGIHTSSEIFDRSTSERWVSRKLDDMANIRNDVSYNIESAINEEHESYDLMKSALEKCSKYLVRIYNIYYDENKTIDDIFDGFVCKDEKLSKLIDSYELKSVFITPNPETMFFMNAYDNYMNALEKTMVISALKEITETLSDKISRYGRPNKSQENQENPNLTTLNKEELDNLFKVANNFLKQTQTQTNTKNKKLIPLYRKLKKKNLHISDKNDINKQISEIKNDLFDLNTRQEKCTEFIDFLNELKSRFESANRDYFSHPISTITEGICDFLAGAKRKKVKFDDIYVHSLEISFIDYFVSLLSGEYTLPYDKRPTTLIETEEEQIFDI